MDATSLVRMSLGSWAHAKIRAMSTRILVVDDDASLAEIIGIIKNKKTAATTIKIDPTPVNNRLTLRFFVFEAKSIAPG